MANSNITPEELLESAEGLLIAQIISCNNDFDDLLVLENGYIINVDGGVERYPVMIGSPFVFHAGDSRLFTTGRNFKPYILSGAIKSADGYTDWAVRTLVIESSDGSSEVISFSRDIGDDNNFQQYSPKPISAPDPTPAPEDSLDELLQSAQGLLISQIIPNGNDFDCIFILENGYVINVDGGTERYPTVVGDSFVYHSGDTRFLTFEKEGKPYIVSGNVLSSFESSGYTGENSRSLVIESLDGSKDVITFSLDYESNSWEEDSSTDIPAPLQAPTSEPTSYPSPEPTLVAGSPNLLKSTLRGKRITMQFDNVLSNTLPSNGKFTVNQGKREYQIVSTDIRASEGIVTLVVEKKLDPAASLTLDYLDFAGDQDSNVIESSYGVDLESFTGFSINNQGNHENKLTIEDGQFEGNQITLFLSESISDTLPSKRRFKVMSSNKRQKILDISSEPDDGVIVLNTKKNLDWEESIFISYRDLGGDQLKGVIEDLAGNDMATIKGYEILSGGNDSTAPTVSSATLDENALTVEFDSIIRNTSISKNRFKVKVNGKRVRVVSATIEGDDSYIELALKPKDLRTIDINSSVTLAYKDPKGDQTKKIVEDMFGNDLDSFGGYGVEIVKI